MAKTKTVKKRKEKIPELSFKCVLGMYEDPLKDFKSCRSCSFGGDNLFFHRSETYNTCPVWKELVKILGKNYVGCPNTSGYRHAITCWTDCTKTKRNTCRTKVTNLETNEQIDRKEFCLNVEEAITKKMKSLQEEAKKLEISNDRIDTEIQRRSDRINELQRFVGAKAEEGPSGSTPDNTDIPKSVAKPKQRQSTVQKGDGVDASKSKPKPRRGRPPKQSSSTSDGREEASKVEKKVRKRTPKLPASSEGATSGNTGDASKKRGRPKGSKNKKKSNK